MVSFFVFPVLKVRVVSVVSLLNPKKGTLTLKQHHTNTRRVVIDHGTYVGLLKFAASEPCGAHAQSHVQIMFHILST